MHGRFLGTKLRDQAKSRDRYLTKLAEQAVVGQLPLDRPMIQIASVWLKRDCGM